jgi:isopenicillin N synthase-like dioxygenase
MFKQAKQFFDLPLEQKLAVDESLSGNSHRGYQRIGGEGNEPGKLPDLKEVWHVCVR